ncbi:hypothetical protein [Acidicapsa ligni]|uniref:hypothetical protein n=1 Tax=Acidicapsa ligni TaxID=542300 RepID=UPI0021DF6F35|nr:hypothetical protein [Acidicapsa ligni]
MPLFFCVASVSVFTFVSIAVWTEARRKERETYYKAESLRRIAEMPGEGARQVIEMLQGEERTRRASAMGKEIKRLEGMKLGGLINVAVGVALLFFLYGMHPERPVYLVGLIPGLIGVALLVYAMVLAPKPSAASAEPMD